MLLEYHTLRTCMVHWVAGLSCAGIISTLSLAGFIGECCFSFSISASSRLCACTPCSPARIPHIALPLQQACAWQMPSRSLAPPVPMHTVFVQDCIAGAVSSTSCHAVRVGSSH